MLPCMNVERLHFVAQAVADEMDELGTVDVVNGLTRALQQMVNNPSDASAQQSLSTTRTQLQERLPTARTNSWPPSDRLILDELDLADVLGNTLLGRVEDILQRNEMTPSVAADELAPILEKLQQVRSEIGSMLDGLRYFQIGQEEVVDLVEVAVSIPRPAVDDELGELGEEFVRLKRILGPFQELALGHREDIRVRAISSSDFTVFLATAPFWILTFAKGVKAIVETYDKILDIQLKRAALAEVDDVPDEALTALDQHIEDRMDAKIKQFVAEQMPTAHDRIDLGRREELATDLTLALNAVANRIGQGYNIDFRTPPDDTPEEGGEEQGTVDESMGAIREISATIRFFPPPPKTMLELPEPDELDLHLDQAGNAIVEEPEPPSQNRE
jgi:hypothetical protein